MTDNLENSIIITETKFSVYLHCMSKIVNNLWLGAYTEASNLKWLVRNNITHILNMGTELDNCFPGKFSYKHVHAKDYESYNLKIHFDDIADWLEQALKSGRVFVHCYRGVSRSTAAVCCYLMKKQNMDFQSAKNLCKIKRPMAYPNSGFVRQ
jgi:protein-tyrosine phosphatase